MAIEDLEQGGPVDVTGLIKNGLRSYLGVPIVGKGRVLGTLCLFNAVPSKSTDALLTLVDAIANQTGIAIENAQLYAEQTATVTKLRELDRLKSSFLANMSHELRTPLNSILGFADVILEELDGPLTDNMGADLKLIQKNGQHLLHLINDVLDMAKIEAGRMNLSPEPFAVRDVLDEVVSITSTLTGDKKVNLRIEEDCDPNISVTADRTRIRQVMINLVNNAIKFTESGQICIHAERNDGHALIAVSDTGIGIPPDKLDTIFQEFAQIDTSSTRKTGGTGLGLPISRRLVEMHGGRLWAESTGIAGDGSTFFVELPIEARIAEPAERTER
jgi:signal transduction histidine kinase